MPIAPTYPGVYIEEIPSGVRTITGVATSITAFIGRASRGPANDPVLINNFGDFERQFGGLGVNYPMSYSVRDFFLNGGAQGLIVRLIKAPGENDDGKARLSVDTLRLVAASEGEWGKKLRATIDTDVSDEVRQSMGLTKDDFLFNLTVRDAGPGGASEKFRNISIVPSPRRIDKVLADASSLVRWDGDWATTKPGDLPKVKAAVDAQKKVLDAQKKLADALKVQPPVQADVDAAKAALAAANTSFNTAAGDLDDAATKAEKQLAAALKKSPPVPTEIAAAEKALADAETATKASSGQPLDQQAYQGSKDNKTGIFALDKADLFNLLCIPPDTRDGSTTSTVYQSAMAYCQERRAMLIVDSPATWSQNKSTAAADAKKGLPDLGLTGQAARNAALYFPRALESDPLRDGQIDSFVPCGIIAGVMARTDVTRGVWKAPAGLDATLSGVNALEVNLNDDENGVLNPLGINCLRFFPVAGRVVWGSRTLRGADQLADEYKYVPVRRLALYIEESLYRGTQWVVFEPNDEPLWAQIRLNVGAFMNNLFRQGAFQGQTPKDAYFVKCDKETTIQNDINLGIVNIIVGFAPLKPAEFVIIKLQQMAGQIQT
jgi:phage tail sheath protein FI